MTLVFNRPLIIGGGSSEGFERFVVVDETPVADPNSNLLVKSNEQATEATDYYRVIGGGSAEWKYPIVFNPFLIIGNSGSQFPILIWSETDEPGCPGAFPIEWENVHIEDLVGGTYINYVELTN